MTFSNDELTKYDTVGTWIYTNIYTLTKNHDYIAINNFDINNIDHRIFFDCAVTWAVLQKQDIEVALPFKSRRKLHKLYKVRIKKVKKNHKIIDIQKDLVEYMLPACQTLVPDFSYSKMYAAWKGLDNANDLL